MFQQHNWYIEYDHQMFSILNKPNFDKHIFKAAQNYVDSAIPQPTEMVVSQWLRSSADAVRQISQLLYNFFYVEQKLANNDLIKNTFVQISTLFKVQNLYSNYCFVRSQNFRASRILGCLLRLNRFLEVVFANIKNIKKSLDETFLENIDEVYIFMQHKLKETLLKTEQLGHHHLNIIILDILSLLLRNFGDQTMGKILDKNKENSIMNLIQKDNQVYQQFEEDKRKETQKFMGNEFVEVVNQIEFDDRTKSKEVDPNDSD